MTIGVAKPAAHELQQVKHYFIDSHSIQDVVNAAVFSAYALHAIETVFRHHDVAVMVGGTGLYIKAFCEGLDELPPVSPATREAISAQYEEMGLEWLQQQVQQQDPLYYATGEIRNPQRLMRALEVIQATGRSIRSFQQGKKAERSFRIIKTALELPKEQLHHNINHRVDHMMEQGLLQEVLQLLPWRHCNALQTVGYKELFDYLDGNSTLDQAIQQIKQNTRQYAKRQMTWFRRDAAYQWFSPADADRIIDLGQS
jgi:tRNA dimethylallyltransferase